MNFLVQEVYIVVVQTPISCSDHKYADNVVVQYVNSGQQ